MSQLEICMQLSIFSEGRRGELKEKKKKTELRPTFHLAEYGDIKKISDEMIHGSANSVIPRDPNRLSLVTRIWQSYREGIVRRNTLPYLIVFWMLLTPFCLWPVSGNSRHYFEFWIVLKMSVLRSLPRDVAPWFKCCNFSLTLSLSLSLGQVTVMKTYESHLAPWLMQCLGAL